MSMFLTFVVLEQCIVAVIYPSHSKNYFLDTLFYTNPQTIDPCNGEHLATFSTPDHLTEILSLCNTATSNNCFIDNDLMITNGASSWEWSDGNDICIANGNVNSFQCQSSNQIYGYPICMLPPENDLNSYLLILRHQDIDEGYFDTTLKNTGLENQDDINSNTYSIIGNLNSWFYRGNDSKFQFKLIYSNIDGTFNELMWKQSSWLNVGGITGYEPIIIGSEASTTSLQQFTGLALSDSSSTYLDGNGDASNWWNSVGANSYHTTSKGRGMPAFNINLARSTALYIHVPQYELLSHLLDVNDGRFTATVRTTGLENENNITANTYCKIGTFDYMNANYIDMNGKYQFKLIYINVNGSIDELIWKQTSWITDTIITGFEAVSIPNQSAFIDTGQQFKGLGYSESSSSYLDGNAQEVDWYNSIGTIASWNGGIPGYAATPSKYGISYYFYIYSFHKVTVSPTLDPTNDPTKYPTNNPTNIPTSSPTKMPTNNPTGAPTRHPSNDPTIFPSKSPTEIPTNIPTTRKPTNIPTVNPTFLPTYSPTNGGEQGIIEPTANITVSSHNDDDQGENDELSSISFSEMMGNNNTSNALIGAFLCGAFLGASIIAVVACLICRKKKSRVMHDKSAEMVKINSVTPVSTAILSVISTPMGTVQVDTNNYGENVQDTQPNIEKNDNQQVNVDLNTDVFPQINAQDVVDDNQSSDTEDSDIAGLYNDQEPQTHDINDHATPM